MNCNFQTEHVIGILTIMYVYEFQIYHFSNIWSYFPLQNELSYLIYVHYEI